VFNVIEAQEHAPSTVAHLRKELAVTGRASTPAHAVVNPSPLSHHSP
jgi:hypothetical protein